MRAKSLPNTVTEYDNGQKRLLSKDSSDDSQPKKKRKRAKLKENDDIVTITDPKQVRMKTLRRKPKPKPKQTPKEVDDQSTTSTAPKSKVKAAKKTTKRKSDFLTPKVKTKRQKIKCPRSEPLDVLTEPRVITGSLREMVPYDDSPNYLKTGEHILQMTDSYEKFKRINTWL